ncbi:MAG: iron ABC transporter permease [Woeseia sp.]|nr:iron ABC transporter permease [Woeseia sp.]
MADTGVLSARLSRAPARKNGYARHRGFGLAIGLIALVATAPLLVAALSLFSDTGDIWQHLLRYVLPEAFANTLLLVCGVAVIAAILGVSLAWFVAVCEFPGRSFFSFALLLPMAMPGYVLGFALAAIFEYTGPLQTGWRSLFGMHVGFPDVGPAGASILTLSLVLYPYVYLITRQGFKTQGVRGIEVAQSCGLRPTKGFFAVSLPMARPWIVAGVSLVIMECLADFGTVQLFNYTTFTTAIYRAWYGLFSLQSALQLSLVLVLLVLGALMLEKRARGNSRFTATSHESLTRLRLGRHSRWAVTVYCSVILLIAFVLPAAMILKWSVSSFIVEFDQRYWSLAANSLMLATLAAVLVCAIALLLAFAVRYSPGKINSGLARLATLGYAIPGTVLAVGFFVPVAALSRWINASGLFGPGTIIALQSGLAVVLLAYLARFMAVAHGPIDSALLRIGPSVEDAARGMGVGGLKLLHRVHLPILKPAIVTAMLLVFVDVMKELPITLMTRPFGWDTLAVKVFQLTTEGQWERAALPALAIVLAGLLPVALLNRRND